MVRSDELNRAAVGRQTVLAELTAALLLKLQRDVGARPVIAQLEPAEPAVVVGVDAQQGGQVAILFV